MISCPINCQINFRHLNTDEGLSNNIVTCFYRDSRGFLWVGTNTALNRYDGNSFTVFNDNKLSHNNLIGNLISDIVEDDSGYIWVATARGALNRYEYQTNSFVAFNPFGDTLAMLNENIMVKDLYIDKNNNLWIAILDGGLFKLDLSNNKFISFYADGKKGSISSNLVSSIAEDSNGNLWVLCNDGVLNKMDYRNGSFEWITYTNGFVGNTMNLYSERLYVDSQDRIWITTQNSGFYIYYPWQNTFRHYTHSNTQNSLSYNTVTGIVELTGNHFWISTDHGGLNLFNLEKETFTHFKQNPNNPSSLSNNQLYSIYKDYEGIIWIGNYMGGINYFTYNNYYFDNYSKSTDNKGLSEKSVLCFLERNNGEIWIGTDGGGINILHPKALGGYSIENIPAINSKLSNGIVASMLEDKKGRIWIGTYLGGLNCIDPKTKKVKKYDLGSTEQNNGQSSGSSIWCLFEDKKNRIWAGTVTSSLMIYDETTDRFTPFPYELDKGNSPLGKMIFSMFQDHKNEYWIASVGKGLDKFYENHSKFVISKPLLKNSEPLVIRTVNTILEDLNFNLLVGTVNGLKIYSENTDSIQQITVNNGLPSNNVAGILIDKHGNYWLGTSNGLCFYNPVKNIAKNYYAVDGIQGQQFNNNACLQSKTGKIFFGSIDGVTSFFPEDISKSDTFFRVVISDVKLFNQSITNSNNLYLKENILTTNRIELAYDENFISITYTALEFLKQQKVSYSYYLEGLEDNWNNVGPLRIANYTDLKPGKYIFHVKATSPDNSSVHGFANLQLIIRPPFWQTGLFRIAVLLTIISSLYVFYFWRIKRYRKQQIKLEKMVNEKTHELSKKNIMLSDQAKTLNKINALLEKRNIQIEKQAEELINQKEELIIQTENLAKANEKLKELNNTKDKFFSIIAHDLKNPFGAILGLSELLKLNKNSITKEKHFAYIDAIYASSTTLFNLLENLLLWSRSQSDSIKFEPKIIQAFELVQSNLLLQNENIKEKDIKVSITIDTAHDMQIYADESMLNTVIRNILSNAIKFTPHKGSIEIICKSYNGKSIIQVADSGEGMTQEEVQQLFRIDTAFSKPGTNGEKGSGLGLILCKEFIDKHNGKIDVTSQPGKGTTFTVSLPVMN